MTIILSAILASASVFAAQEPPLDPDLRNQLEADVRFLSDDLLEGRDVGTPGYDIAARYVAEGFRGIGLTPGGDDGSYLQTIPMYASVSLLTGGAEVSIGPAGAEEDWQPKVDFVGGGGADVALKNVPIVFAGYGFVSEEHGRDDFANLDVEGKIVATISGAPKFLNSEERAHFGRQRSANAAKRGAIGTISILLPSYEENVRTFGRIAARVDERRSVTWLDEKGEPYARYPELKAELTLGQDGANKLFSHARRSWADFAKVAETDQGLVEGFDTGLTATIRTEKKTDLFDSANVIAMLPGSDPDLRHEIISISAHLDHIGTRRTIEADADRIYNGAMDNAVGVGGLLDIARRLKDDPPARTIMFVALTAEEKGLLGSRYLVETWDEEAKGPIVGAFNFDMPILHEDFTDIVVFGIERTTMEPVIAGVIEEYGLQLKPDPYPEQGFFTRSDQYSFVQGGIPAAYIDQATRPNSDDVTQEFLRERYHQVSDEADAVAFDDLARFSSLNAAVIEAVANTPARPLWRAGDFFGRIFEGPMEDAE